MTNTQKLIAVGIVGVALVVGYALVNNDSASKSVSKRGNNFNGTRTVLPNGEKDRDCGDFRTQREAQEFFEENGGPAKDPHSLDRDKDGRVCESLK